VTPVSPQYVILCSSCQGGVALAVHRNVMSACFSWTPINERLLCARFQHNASHLSVIVAYALTESAAMAVKDQFYVQLKVAVTDCKENVLLMDIQ